MTQEEKVRQVFVEAMGAEACEGCSLTEMAVVLVSQRDNAQNAKKMFDARLAGKAAQINALETSVDELINEVSAEKKLRHSAMRSMAQGVEFDEEAKVKVAAAMARAEIAVNAVSKMRVVLNMLRNAYIGNRSSPWVSSAMLEAVCNVLKEVEESSVDGLQVRVDHWLMKCFGEEIARNKSERNHRFLEEALELVQACGCVCQEAHNLVNYVFAREAGEKVQEVGGVVLTLAALCLAQNIDMQDAGEKELARVWTKVDIIRQKQAAKPKNSPLPQ